MVRKLLRNIFHTEQDTPRAVPFLMQLPLYALIASACLITSWYFYRNHSLIPSTEKKLQKLLYEAESTVNSFLKTAEKNACALAELPQTQKTLSALFQNKSTPEEEASYDLFILSQQESMSFKNILLIDKDKTIRYAATTKDIIGKQLTTSLKNTFLSLSYERSMMSLTPDFSEYGHNPLFEDPTLFLCVPVIENKKFIGILAYECDVEKLMHFTNQYSQLGKTGEIALAQESNGFILFIAPSRHDRDLAFKRKKLFSKNPPAIQKSVLGGQGNGVAIDYRSVRTVAAWTFIPKVNWGMIIKMDMSEVEQPLQCILILLVINLLCLIIWMGIIEKFYNKPLTHFFHRVLSASFIQKLPSAIKNIFLILCLITCALLINTIIRYNIFYSTAINEATQKIITEVNNSAEDINLILKKISFTTQSLADDLKLKRLSKEDITKRIKRDLAENDNILGITIAFAPYKYDANIKLYAPTIFRTDDSYKESMLEDDYDYTNVDPHNITTSWYRTAVESGHAWLNSYKKENGKTIDSSYVLAFFNDKNELQGVIRISYNFTAIERITAYNSLDRKGYSFLLSEKEKFLSHPIKSLVKSETTLFHYAQDIDNKALTEIAQNISKNEPLLASYNQNKYNTMWVYTSPISVNNWTLGTIFSKNDIALSPETTRLYYFWMLIYSLITLFFACAYIRSLKYISTITYSVFITILLLLGLIIAWRIIQVSYSYIKTNSTVITDQASLDKFLDDLQEESKRKNEENPIEIPCGLLLYSLDMVQTEEMSITGYIWTKYNLDLHKDIAHKILLPHATQLINETPTTAVSNNWETVTWNIRGTIYEKQYYDQFPFDKQQMQITIEHHDIDKNIILIPDLEDYKKISPEETPGLDKSFTLSEFDIEETFFTYKKFDPVTNFGFKQYGKTTDHFQLVYNLIISRGLLSPFILYFLPFLVILFSLFAILLVAEKKTEPLRVITPYSGLFFALVLLHRSLREQYSTGTTLYMEYAFFFAYITFIILVIHAVIVDLYPDWEYYQNKIVPLAKLLFWPLQLASWLITTFIVFY